MHFTKAVLRKAQKESSILWKLSQSLSHVTVSRFILLSYKQQTNHYISRTEPMGVGRQNFRTTNNSQYSSDLSIVKVTDIVRYNNEIE